jgi:hypothetical protein
MAEFLRTLSVTDSDYAMVSFPLKNTLSPHGTVSRGICKVNQKNFLQEVVEHTQIQRKENKIFSAESLAPLSPELPVSMNFWGFTPTIFSWLSEQFIEFLRAHRTNLEKVEYYIPTAIDEGIKKGRFTVRVLPSEAQWFGITHRQDVEWVQRELPVLKVSS